jgi:glycosyltransferase involved in cell wall biosynthesis
MRIAYLSTFYPFRGGIAQFNALLYNQFLKQGHQTKAFTFTTQYPSILFPGETQFVKENDSAEVIDSQRILSTTNPLSWYKSAKIIKKYNPDLMIMKFWMPYFAPSLGFVAGKLKNHTKSISILDNVIPHEKKFFDKSLTKYFLSKNHAFIAMSEKVKNDLLQLEPKAKVQVLPHPLYNHFGEINDKTQARDILGIDKNKKTILFFGFIREYKGLDLLIEAFDKLDDSYQLLIAGEVYGNFEKYNQIISKNKNKNNIHKFVRYISDDEVNKFFCAADVCILPYKSATQSGITGISYHFELPMIATATGGLPEIIHHNKTGFIIEKINSNAIADAIQKYFKNCDSEKLKENIRTLKKELSWEVFAEKIIEFATNL